MLELKIDIHIRPMYTSYVTIRLCHHPSVVAVLLLLVSEDVVSVVLVCVEK